MSSKNVGKAVVTWLVLHMIHELLSEEVDQLSAKYGWTSQQVELAKLAVSGAMLVL